MIVAYEQLLLIIYTGAVKSLSNLPPPDDGALSLSL